MPLMCSPFLFSNIDPPSFSSWCNQIIIIIFFLSFSNFFILMDFLLVNRLSNKSANHQCEVTLVRGNLKKIFALLSLKGVTKVHILCFMIKKHGHTSFPKHDYFLFQEVSTHEENWFMLQVVPYFYSCLFFA